MNNRLKMLSIAMLGALMIVGNSMQAMNSDTVKNLVQAAAQTACNNSDVVKSMLENSRDVSILLTGAAWLSALFLSYDVPPYGPYDDFDKQVLADLNMCVRAGVGFAALAAGSNVVKNALPKLCAWATSK